MFHWLVSRNTLRHFAKKNMHRFILLSFSDFLQFARYIHLQHVLLKYIVPTVGHFDLGRVTSGVFWPWQIEDCLEAVSLLILSAQRILDPLNPCSSDTPPHLLQVRPHVFFQLYNHKGRTTVLILVMQVLGVCTKRRVSGIRWIESVLLYISHCK